MLNAPSPVCGEKPVVSRVEDVQQHILEAVHVEALVPAHDLGGVGPLVPVDAGGEGRVGATVELGERAGPRVEDVPRGGRSLVATVLPIGGGALGVVAVLGAGALPGSVLGVFGGFGLFDTCGVCGVCGNVGIFGGFRAGPGVLNLIVGSAAVG